jgi:hypothetical protein
MPTKESLAIIMLNEAYLRCSPILLFLRPLFH